ncbi:MAG TPA: YbaK/EbsC family protein [Candidatus Limnocylindria bacterium]|nr:YbaK/EbsC family protein [Candidatus Limnocylindria bacterium]
MAGAEDRFVAAAAVAGLEIAVRRFPEGTRTAEDAARAVGCEVAQIVKSLVFVADGQPVVALVSGAHRVEPARLAAALGATRVERADGDLVRDATGFAIGGVPPLGHARPMPIVMDSALLAHDLLWAAAGRPDAVFAVTPTDLERASGAVVADLGEEPAAGRGPG